MGATIATAGIVCALGIAATAFVGLGAAASESQRAAGIADAAALAAADTLAGFAAGEPCRNAEAVAISQTASIARCDLEGLIATVEIRSHFGAIPVTAIARAGPPR